MLIADLEYVACGGIDVVESCTLPSVTPGLACLSLDAGHPQWDTRDQE